ncbi:MAG TPA: hypothetical protein VIB79_13130 [Candidatus Binatia bacterium]|jgi:hypothetical protein
MTLAAEGEFAGSVAQQNLLEFLAIVTNPKPVGSPVGLREALEPCECVSFFLHASDAETWHVPDFRTIGQTKWGGARERLFDLYLAATVVDNDVPHICTWNTKHFRRLPGVAIVTPSELLSSLSRGIQ